MGVSKQVGSGFKPATASVAEDASSFIAQLWLGRFINGFIRASDTTTIAGLWKPSAGRN